jgi:excisionase family DNA binding protein
MIYNEEIYRLFNFPNMVTYLATLSNDQGESIPKADNIIMELIYALEKKRNELSYIKLKREFSFTLLTAKNDELKDYSTPEVAKILGRTPATVRSYIKSGKLKAYQTFNEDFRVTKEDLSNFLNTMRISRKVN